MRYHDLIAAWHGELERHEHVLRRWYGVTAIGYSLALTSVRHWQESFFPDAGAIAAIRDGQVTVDTSPLHYKPRLWKGPLRVLREASSSSDVPGPT